MEIKEGKEFEECRKLLKEVINIAIEEDASDIHLTKNLEPTIRIDGNLTKVSDIKLEHLDLTTITYIVLGQNEKNLKQFIKENKYDSSITVGETRLRVHVYKQKDSPALALRLIANNIPTIEEINLPPAINKITEMKNGLVLVTGITGSGKSTTLASIIDKINREEKKHIITIEEPIEYVHEHKKSIVNQREVGSDVDSFHEAVSDAMREDPEVILLGEMRDLETISAAITLAETGHLVLATLHTRNVPETVNRIIDVFPGNEQSQIRTQLSSAISAIVSQELLPHKSGKGRVPCCEIMFSNNAIRAIIKNSDNSSNILDDMASKSLTTGSQTRLQALVKLVLKGDISLEIAQSGLSDKDKETLVRMIKRGMRY